MLSVVPYIKSFQVSFTPSKELDVVGYKIHASQTSGFTPIDLPVGEGGTLINDGPETSYIHKVATGGNYYVRVAAYDSFGTEGLNYSTEVAVTVATTDPLDTVAPAPPTGLALTTVALTSLSTDASTVRATWNANTEDDLYGYIIRKKQGSAPIEEVSVTAPTVGYTFDGLIPGLIYSFQIAAVDKWGNVSGFVNAAGASAWSTITTAVDTTPPTAPTAVDVSTGILQLTVKIAGMNIYSWASCSIEICTASDFSVVYQTVTTKSNSATVAVPPGTYWVRARAISRNAVASAYTDGAPTSVTVEQAYDDIKTALIGRLTTNQLVTDLNTRINLIDQGTLDTTAASGGIMQRLKNTGTDITNLQIQVASLSNNAYASNKAYVLDNIVSYNSKLYKCILAYTSPATTPYPDTDTTHWLKISDYADWIAAVTEETNTRVSEDGALADAITGVTSTYNGTTTAAQVALESIDGINAKYSVKIDAAGYVVGFGLIANAAKNDTPADSLFYVNAQKFVIGHPSTDSNTTTPKYPFIVDSGKVYMDTAFIKAATITEAMIGTLSATKLTTGTLDANRIAAGSITTDKLTVVGSGMAINSDPNTMDSTQWTGAAVIAVSGGVSVLRATSLSYMYSKKFPVKPSKAYRISQYVRDRNGVGVAGTVGTTIEWYDGDDTILGSVGPTTANITASFVEWNNTITSHPSAVSARFKIGFSSSTAYNNGELTDIKFVEAISDSFITTITPGKITTGALSATATITVGTTFGNGDSPIALSGSSSKLTVSDGTTNGSEIVRIGLQANGKYGISVKNTSGQQTFYTHSDGTTRIENAYLNSLTVSGTGGILCGTSGTSAFKVWEPSAGLTNLFIGNYNPVGGAGTNYLLWDGTTLKVKGNILMDANSTMSWSNITSGTPANITAAAAAPTSPILNSLVTVGGRNLLAGLTTIAWGLHSTTSVTFLAPSKVPGAPTVRLQHIASGADSYYLPGKFPVYAGQSYKVSFWAKATGADTVYTSMGWMQADVAPANLTSSGYSGAAPTVWTYYEFSGTATTDDTAHIVLRPVTTVLGAFMDYTGIKVEVGNKATDWTPAPEDLVVSSNEAFSTYQTWDFNGVDHGWTAAGSATLSTAATYLRITATSADPIMRLTGLSYSGIVNSKIKVRLRRMAGSGWQGACYYTTSGHGEASTYLKVLSQPIELQKGSTWYTLVFDMSVLDAGGTDYTTNTITGLRFDFGNSASDIFDIDFIAVGRFADTATSNTAYSQSTRPTSPQPGDTWFNTSAVVVESVYQPNTSYSYSGTAWVQTSPNGTQITSTGIYTGTLTGNTFQTVAGVGSGTAGTKMNANGLIVHDGTVVRVKLGNLSLL